MWEYKVIKLSTIGFKGGYINISVFNEQLNLYGKEGWELVTSFDTNEDSGKSREVITVFKRYKLEGV